MGNLPADRVNKSKPFTSTGTDLMGPIQIKCGRNLLKRYVCIFTCLASRAVHFEIVQSLEASAFLQAFRRFCNRRNVKPRNLYSDNGGNFVAAKREIKEGVKRWNQRNLHNELRQVNTNWNFNPPCASHQGGFYETFFRLVRKLMKSIVGEATLDEFDLLTLMTEIEHILNNRPITQLPSQPDDLSALTPNMILTGVTCENAPPDVFMKSDVYRRSWRKTQFLADEFWRRWMLEYLPLLQPRQKWFSCSPNLKPGDLVLVMNDQTKRGAWPKAVIEEVFPDKAGLVRRVKVQTADAKTFLRDIRKICLLESHAKN